MDPAHDITARPTTMCVGEMNAIYSKRRAPVNIDPRAVFIGLMDIFSILLPGALLTYLLMGQMGPVVLGERYTKLAGAEASATFLFASYLLGHLVFLLGSWLDGIYNTECTLRAIGYMS